MRDTCNAITSELSESIRLMTDVPSSRATSFGVGANLPIILSPCDLNSLLELLAVFQKKSIPYRVLGAGSNLVLPDNEISEIVVQLGKAFEGSSEVADSVDVQHLLDGTSFAGIRPSESGNCRIFVGAACSLMALSRKCSVVGLSGLEFAAGIPASVGGATYMNAGAHGGSISEVVHAVHLVDSAGSIRRIDRKTIPFSYRHSGISPGEIVIGVEIELKNKPAELVLAERRAALDYRRRTQPLHLPSAGSVFRNPSASIHEQSAGALLEQSGLKGVESGHIQFSTLHANWLVRTSAHGRSGDVRKLVDMGREKVLQKFSVPLIEEIIFW